MEKTRQKKNGDKRQIFPLRLSLDERVELELRAKEAGLKLSEYLRSAGLNRPHRPIVPEINRNTYVELGRIGNNLNQLTKACHTALQQGHSFNLDISLLQSLANQLEQLRLEVLAVDLETEDDR